MAAGQATLLKLASTSGESFDELLRTFLSTSARTLQCQRTSYWEYLPERSVLRCRALHVEGSRELTSGDELPVAGNEPYFAALQRDAIVEVSNVAADPRTSSFPSTRHSDGALRSVLDVPISSERELKAILCHEASGERQWSDEDKDFAVSLANLLAVRRMEEVRQLQQRVVLKLQRTLVEFSLGTYASAEDWMERAFPAVADALNVDAVGFLRLEGNGSLLRGDRKYVSATKSWEAGKTLREEQAEGYFTALRSSAVVAIQDSSKDPRCDDLDAEFKRCCARAFVDVLVLVDGAQYGVFRASVESTPRAWTAEELGFSTSLATLLSLRFAESQRRAAEHQLRVTDRLASVGTLAAGVAHEINNPLGFIMGNLEFLRSELPPQEQTELAAEMHAAIDDAMSGARRIRDIVSDLKALSHDNGEVSLRPVDLKHVVSLSVRMAQSALKHRATLTVDVPDGLLLLGNEARLGQVFLNLMVNASQAMPERPATDNQVHVRARIVDGLIEVVVRDNGSGMTEDVRQRVFDPFFTTKPVGVGTGLGLSIAHGIVTQLGGTISASSALGRGTTFTLRFPQSSMSGIAARHDKGAPATTMRRARILVVDDEPMSGVAIRRVLSEHQVEAVTDANEALRRFDAGEQYDIVLCDLMMPVMTGMDLYDQVSERHPQLLSRFIFITGGAVTEAARRFLQQTHIQKLFKPFDLDRLRAVVSQTLDS